jgi:hypothetical protein
MMQRFNNWFSLPVFFLFLLFAVSCKERPKSIEVASDQFVVRDFIPLTNWTTDSNANPVSGHQLKKAIILDYTGSLNNGFVIPSFKQVKDGNFEFVFSLKNTCSSSRKFYYKIYYQNESYKFPERDELDSTKQNQYAVENFYGSWEDVARTFAETELIPADNEFHAVRDVVRITGNPRSEQRYYMNDKNDRWKRNPRVGDYSFLLVVTSEENLKQKMIPEWVQNISVLHENSFVNPYFFFLYGEGKKLSNTVSQKSPYLLKVIARPDLAQGIYINPQFFPGEVDKNHFSRNCGMDSSIYRSATIQQFVHFIDPGTKYYNIPVIADVLKDNYSKMDYNWNRQFYRKDELIGMLATTTKKPCETVYFDGENNKLIIKNPGTKPGEWEKQDVGIITRHGLTYGKYTVKAKLTELLNKNGLWNGLTNAIWLIAQDQSDWNARRDCNKEGYLANYYGGAADKRVKNVSYSEIDFEILKTVPYCPYYLLPPAYNFGSADENRIENWNVPFPEEIVENDGDITVSCTNWDMACWEPSNFQAGCSPIDYLGQTFWLHRWDMGYRAITSKVQAPDDELFGSAYFYFQIDWRPDEIIWRIGPEKNKMRVVGYVNGTVSSIPNNQMLLIISQEFHNTKWWIGSPYSQDNIPYPKNDIVGEVYEITIE